MRGKPGRWPPATQGVPTPTSSSSWSPRHPAFSSSEFWLATDTSGWLRSPALSSSWRWEHQQTHGRGGLSQPRTLPTPPNPARLPCPYQQSPPPRLATLVLPAQEQGSAQQQHGHHGQGQDHQGGLHHLL